MFKYFYFNCWVPALSLYDARYAGIILVSLLVGCSADEKRPESLRSGTGPLLSAADAKFVTGMILSTIDRAVIGRINGTVISDKQIDGASGTAVVNGSFAPLEINCRFGCVTSQADADLSIVFDHFTTQLPNQEHMLISGTVKFIDKRWITRDNGGIGETGGAVSVEGDSVVLEIQNEPIGRRYMDTLTFYAAGDGPDSLQGHCENGGGEQFDF